ncbi:hypothetical protein SS50377_23285 [Spironucleus salmonicida]|uniref:Uncharacterized protein n=1 Tax=Spironucleus salmonicida TaxID=348837 RepID=V6LSD0_9EUKA|nr:hypothetical protein SS50377_23285 [Spironucleus salmonicida]|eukprot:EST47153.1 Hypothetical protein SS50377_12664 [Spironucleus salmonicida]
MTQQQDQDQNKATDIFSPELFIEMSEGQDDKIPSDSELEHVEGDQKDPGNTQLFSKLVTAINDISTLQAALAVSTINSSIDFSSTKLRTLFIQHGGVKALFRAINNMTFTLLSPEKRMQYVQQYLPRVDPKYGYESLLILATLSELAKDSRSALLAEDAIRIGLTLCKTQFASNVGFQALLRARALRMVAGCAKDSKARNFMRRIQAIQLLQRQFKQSIKDFQMNQNAENGSVICAISQVFEQLMKSNRCKNTMIKTGGVGMLVQALNELPVNVPITTDLIEQCGGQKRNLDQNDLCIESITNTLRQLSLLQTGRAEIQVTKGINSVVNLFKKTQSARITQRAVAILANCAQDSGVDQTVRTAGGLKYLSSLLTTGDHETTMAICRTIVSVCRSGPYFGGVQTCLEHDETDFLSFNERNEENILELCKIGAVGNLTSHIDVPIDLLCCSDANNLLVTGQVQPQNIKPAQHLRDLAVQATNALVPLLSSVDGRKALKGNAGLFKALISHLQVADVDILVATLFSLSTASENDSDICKKIGESEGLRYMFTLLRHNNLQVVCAAAKALTPVLRDKTRSFKVGRSLTTSLEVIATLLKRKFEADPTDQYAPRLVLETRGWLMGVVAELAQDRENAKVLTEYEVLPVICELLKQHSKVNSRTERSYDFYIDLLIKEKSCLAIATLSKINDNMACTADMGTIPALVRSIQSPDGCSVFDSQSLQKHRNANLTYIEAVGIALQPCPNKFGSEVNFKEPAYSQREPPVDRDPQATRNPYFVVNRAACKAMSEISKNKKCALLLRQHGAVYGLLTLVGHVDKDTQNSSASAITNIRIHHITSLEVYKERIESETHQDPQKVKDAAMVLYQDDCFIGGQERKPGGLAEGGLNNMSFQIRRNMTFNIEGNERPEELISDDLFLQKTSASLARTQAGNFQTNLQQTSVLTGPDQMDERILTGNAGIRKGEGKTPAPQKAENITPAPGVVSEPQPIQPVEPAADKSSVKQLLEGELE